MDVESYTARTAYGHYTHACTHAVTPTLTRTPSCCYIMIVVDDHHIIYVWLRCSTQTRLGVVVCTKTAFTAETCVGMD